jgi:hypothetical protein
MMVLLWKSVECSAKIAMTALLTGFAAMVLLPDRDPPRRIFLEATRGAYFLIPQSAEELDLPDFTMRQRNAAAWNFRL